VKQYLSYALLKTVGLLLFTYRGLDRLNIASSLS